MQNLYSFELPNYTPLDLKARINRKVFLKIASLLISGWFVYIWSMMTGKKREMEVAGETIRIKMNELGIDTYFFEKFILVKTDKKTLLFSNKCTHAGCRISQQIENELVCPCHGSRFDALSGEVITGPALKSLQPIHYSTDTQTGEIFVKI